MMGLTAIVKPTHECNLSCKYCYVDDSAEQGRMSYQTLIITMEHIAKYSKDKHAHFIWHGGEPLLMGLDFYKEAAKISHKLRKEGYRISNGIQSNATLITDEFLDFIKKENDFQLGFSLDGPKEINDKTRIYPDGKGAFDDIITGVRKVRDRKIGGRIKKRNLGGGVIVVLNRENIGYIRDVYKFFKKERINIKVNPLIASDQKSAQLKISPVEYAKAMVSLFDMWINDYKSIDIDPFTMIMGNLMTGHPIGCNYSVSCRENFISVGPQGDIYPCGRFDGLKEFWMGNINEENGLENALNSDVQKRLSKRRLENIPGCKTCDYGKICNAGCMHNALITGDVMGKDNFCAGYKKLFKHIETFLHIELVKAEVKNEKKN